MGEFDILSRLVSITMAVLIIR